MSSGYVPYSDVYDDPDYRDRERRPDRSRVQYEPAENVAGAQWQQLRAFNQPGRRRSELNASNLDSHQRNSQRRYLRERSADDAYYSRRRSRRQDSYDSQSDSDSEPDDRRRRRDDDNGTSARRAQSEKRPGEGNPSKHYDGDMKGLAERNLDFSPDGALFAALGAGVGAIAARRFGGNHFDPKQGNQNWKTIAGAVVGGVAANAAATKWTHRREEKKVKQDYSNLESDQYERQDDSRRKRLLQ